MKLRIRALGAACALAVALVALPAAADDAGQKQALELFEQGKSAYKEGRFADSVALLEKAYALYPEPVLLYNLARSQEGLGQFSLAIEAYEKYLASEKDVPDRGAIEQKVANLKRTVEEQAKLAKERDDALRADKDGAKGPDQPPPPEEQSISPWPWVLAGLGVGGVVAGAVTGSMAVSRNDDAESAPSQKETAQLRGEAEDLALVSSVAFGVGGALAAGGIIWGIVDVTMGSSDADAKVSVRAAPGSVWISGRF
ncbi:MAG: tetratricopeptide repeat protein [Polyangiaceae bacterium]|nr:tetratricopeptide repeat protein [Polyangiaceae bacterium]